MLHVTYIRLFQYLDIIVQHPTIHKKKISKWNTPKATHETSRLIYYNIKIQLLQHQYSTIATSVLSVTGISTEAVARRRCLARLSTIEMLMRVRCLPGARRPSLCVGSRGRPSAPPVQVSLQPPMHCSPALTRQFLAPPSSRPDERCILERQVQEKQGRREGSRKV